MAFAAAAALSARRRAAPLAMLLAFALACAQLAALAEASSLDSRSNAELGAACTFDDGTSMKIYDAFKPGGDESLFDSLQLDCNTMLNSAVAGGVVGAVGGAVAGAVAGEMAGAVAGSVVCGLLTDKDSFFGSLCNGLFHGAGMQAGMAKGAEAGQKLGVKMGVYASVALFSKRKGSKLGEVIADCHATYAGLGAPLAASPGAAEVKAAYRVASRKSHPDRGGSQEAFVKTRMCYEAFLARAGVYAKSEAGNAGADDL